VLQVIIVAVLVAGAMVYVIRSIVRSARGQDCHCDSAGCTLSHDGKPTEAPCRNLSTTVAADTLENSARRLRPKSQ
jgi:hypothetical protein